MKEQIDISKWRDKAHLIPQRVGRMRLKIVHTKILEFSAIKREFDDEDLDVQHKHDEIWR